MLILKNIDPSLASQLRSSRVMTVDELVHLGQQLEKDRDNQQQYEHRKQAKTPPKPADHRPHPDSTVRQRQPNYTQNHNRPSQPFCCRCKDNPSPAASPRVGTNRSPLPSNPP
ncbi:hypothetical protein ATANTOWER_029156 [Ataeniobius toweri]|uniref:Uncharacterized protein n=1 Tax=Ataeniobius toweri TaxID=208326 RepID=A0ABU7AVU3_9TELE|nr:hypothetical protein [Ataeniobius toweri]